MKKYHYFKKLFYICLGNFLLAVSVYVFIDPFSIITGGVGGLALLIRYFTQIPLAFSTFVLNILLFILGYKFLGKEFALSTALSTFLYPVFIFLLEQFPNIQTICNDMILASIFSGILLGLGIGLVMKEGASTGGMDIPPLILYQKTRASLGLLVALFDYSVLLIQIPFHTINEILYGILSVLLSSFVIDQVMLSSNNKVQMLIISPEFELIRHRLLKYDLGVTLIHIQTGLENIEQAAVLSIFHQRQLNNIENIVQHIDPDAFIIVSQATEVRGRGFTKEKFYLNQLEQDT